MSGEGNSSEAAERPVGERMILERIVCWANRWGNPSPPHLFESWLLKRVRPATSTMLFTRI